MGYIVKEPRSSGAEHQVKIIKFDIDASQDGNDGAIADLWRKWRNLYSLRGRVPSTTDFKDDNLFYVDVTPENPMDFVMTVHPNGAAGNFTGRKLAEHPSELHRLSIAEDWGLSKSIQKPSYIELDQTVRAGGPEGAYYIHRNYRRLAVPLIGESGQVERLAYAIRFLTPAVIESQVA